LALLAGVLTLAVAACGGGSSDGVASLSGSDKATTTTNANSGRDNRPAAALNWARCMRQHGINLPDPKITPDGIDLPKASVKPDDPKFRAAEQTCK
jgi:hypothetical protein